MKVGAFKTWQINDKLKWVVSTHKSKNRKSVTDWRIFKVIPIYWCACKDAFSNWNWNYENSWKLWTSRMMTESIYPKNIFFG